MEQKLKKNGYRFSAVLEAIVGSRQFREIRGQRRGGAIMNRVDRRRAMVDLRTTNAHYFPRGTTMNQQTFSRRTFLRGLGVTMALPWLESLRVWGDEARAVRGASEAPVRLAVLFAGNGFHSKEWWARGSGKSMELGKVLAPARRLPREDALHPRPLSTPRP